MLFRFWWRSWQRTRRINLGRVFLVLVVAVSVFAVAQPPLSADNETKFYPVTNAELVDVIRSSDEYRSDILLVALSRDSNGDRYFLSWNYRLWGAPLDLNSRMVQESTRQQSILHSVHRGRIVGTRRCAQKCSQRSAYFYALRYCLADVSYGQIVGVQRRHYNGRITKLNSQPRSLVDPELILYRDELFMGNVRIDSSRKKSPNSGCTQSRLHKNVEPWTGASLCNGGLASCIGSLYRMHSWGGTARSCSIGIGGCVSAMIGAAIFALYLNN